MESVNVQLSTVTVSLQFIAGLYTELKMFLLQFSFQATIGRNYTGGIALDDVTLSDGLCENESESQNNRQGINVSSPQIHLVELW